MIKAITRPKELIADFVCARTGADGRPLFEPTGLLSSATAVEDACIAPLSLVRLIGSS